MTRIDGWQARLKKTIEVHMTLPSVYGVSDCYQICNDAVIAVTGAPMFKDVSYSSAIGAAKVLKNRGFDTVSDAFASLYESISPAIAQRGDIGVTLNDGQLCGGVFTALGFMVRDKHSVRFIPVTDVKTAFKVAR